METKLNDKHLEFITAGQAFFTVKNEDNGNRVTFRVVDTARIFKDESKPAHTMLFVSYLNGPENTKNYAFIGTIYKHRETGKFCYKHSAKARATEDSRPVKVIKWVLSRLQTNVS